tara:strand:- start:401 stop:712 length:312 start_codon:yes stop_codon:yes gene_type:complete
MSQNPLEKTSDLTTRLNSETAKIGWVDLQKHYATGNVMGVSSRADLIQVAEAFHKDDREKVESWLSDNTLFEVNDQQALDWYNNNTEHWAVVIPPFVLVQEVN